MNLRHPKLMVVAVAVVILAASLAYVSFRMNASRIYHIQVKVSLPGTSFNQGGSLVVFVNSTSPNIPFNLNGQTYQSGLLLVYLGLSPSGTNSSMPFQGLVKYNITNHMTHIKSEWNGTVYRHVGNALVYYTAPAGYYKLEEGSNTLNSYNGNQIAVNFTITNATIQLRGSYSNISVGANNTLKIESENFGVTGSYPATYSVVSHFNNTTYWKNVSNMIPGTTYVYFHHLYNTPYNYLIIYVRFNGFIIQYDINSYGGPFS